MLVLTRKVGEKIHIGSEVVITIVRIQNDKVRIGIEAPLHVVVHREEVRERANRRDQTAPVAGVDPSP